MPLTAAPSLNQPPQSGQRSHTQAPIPAERLFQGNQEVQIVHNGGTYRLRITRNGKLILTK